MYEGWRSTLNECYPLPSYVLRQVFLLTLQLAVLERLAGVWLGSGWGLAGGWLLADWTAIPRDPPVFAHPALGSQMSTWTLGFVLYAGAGNLNSCSRACTGKAIFPLSHLPATSVSVRLFPSFVAHLFCTRTQPWSSVKLDSPFSFSFSAFPSSH